jgi:membrane protein
VISRGINGQGDPLESTWKKVKAFFTTVGSTIAQAWRKFSGEDGPQAAAAFSFYAFLSLIALVVLAGFVLGTVLKGNQELLNNIIEYITENFPAASDYIKEALTSSIKLRGVLGVIGILGLLYSGTKVFDSFQVWLNNMWGVEKPKYLKKKSKSLVSIVFLGFVLITGFALHYYLFGSHILSFLLLVIVFLIGMIFIYSFSPEVKLGFKKVWAGSLFVAILIYPLQALLTWYYTSYSDFTTVYGSLASFLIAIIAIYYVGYIIYLGAALNRVLDKDAEEVSYPETEAA